MNEGRITANRSRKLPKHSSWHSRLQGVRRAIRGKKSRVPTIPMPIHPDPKESDEKSGEEVVGSGVDRPDGGLKKGDNRGKAFDVEENRSSPPRAQFDVRKFHDCSQEYTRKWFRATRTP